MMKLFKQFSDPKLARKMMLVRAVFLFFGAVWTLLVVSYAASGEIIARSSVSNSLSRAVLVNVDWSERPVVFLANVLWLLGSGLVFIVGCYIAMARLIDKWHGRRLPFYKRKYPY